MRNIQDWCISRQIWFGHRIPVWYKGDQVHCSVLGPDDDIARFEYLKKSARNFGSVLIGIETSSPQNFRALTDQLDAAGFMYRDITSDEVLSEFLI